MCCLPNVTKRGESLVATRKRQLRIRQERPSIGTFFSFLFLCSTCILPFKKRKENNSLFNVWSKTYVNPFSSSFQGQRCALCCTVTAPYPACVDSNTRDGVCVCVCYRLDWSEWKRVSSPYMRNCLVHYTQAKQNENRKKTQTSPVTCFNVHHVDFRQRVEALWASISEQFHSVSLSRCNTFYARPKWKKGCDATLINLPPTPGILPHLHSALSPFAFFLLLF